MPLPAGMTTCTYTFGTDMDFRGEVGAVRVTIEPDFGGDANHIIWQATGQVLADFEFGGEAASGQNVSIDLPHVNQDGFVAPSQQTITDFAYRATIVARAPDGTERVRYKTLTPKVGQSAIDGDTVPSDDTTAPIFGPHVGITDIDGNVGSIELGPNLTIVDGVLDVPTAGGAGDTETAAFIADSGSDTRAVLDPLIDLRAGVVVDEKTETPVSLPLLYAALRSQ